MLPESRTPEGREALDALVADPEKAVVALDYDGTLAPITTRPEDAVPVPGALAALTACATTFGTVAIVTGRPAAVVVSLAGAATVDRLVVLGHYGEERWTASEGLSRPPEHPGLADARRLLREAFSETSLEEKGISVAVHTRAADDPDAALAEAIPVVERIAARTGLAVNHGRYLVELRAPGARDKRDAILSLTDGATSLLFAGDDLVDMPAYEAVHEFRRGGGYGVGIFVDNPEAPRVREMADVIVPDTETCVALLDSLARAARSG